MPIFRVKSVKIYTGQLFFYIDTVCGVCDKYEVCMEPALRKFYFYSFSWGVLGAWYRKWIWCSTRSWLAKKEQSKSPFLWNSILNKINTKIVNMIKLGGTGEGRGCCPLPDVLPPSATCSLHFNCFPMHNCKKFLSIRNPHLHMEVSKEL